MIWYQEDNDDRCDRVHHEEIDNHITGLFGVGFVSLESCQKQYN